MPNMAPLSPSEPGRSTPSSTLTVVALGATVVVPLLDGAAPAGAAMAAAISPAEATVAAMRVDLRMSGSS
jgi:hypothetical protein